MNPELIYSATTLYPYIEVDEWCLENVGEWNITWYKLGQDPLANFVGDMTSQYYFADEQSAVLFKLKWS